jgi:hypothetical protein
MPAQSRFSFVLTCSLTVIASATACNRNPYRAATGEEIAAAVRNAEAEMVLAKTASASLPCDPALTSAGASCKPTAEPETAALALSARR